MSTQCVVIAVAIAAASGVPGLFVRRDSLVGQYVACLLACGAAVTGMVGVVRFFQSGEADIVTRPWPVPGGEFAVAIDGLSAIFLLPVQIIFMLGSVYGLSYWRQTEHPQNGRKLRLFYGLSAAGMMLLVIARNSILFLAGWEIMALSAFFLVATEDHDEAVRETSWLYLVATHLATLCLFALFALIHGATDSFAIAPIDQSNLTAETQTAMFVLALLGFGLKAGIMPLHVWLPSSHAIAPSHVSAIMSGVFIKMGIYGLVRFLSLFESPPVQWGAVVLVLGVVSGVLGVAFAIGQHDLKRLLAYHSIENIGIIVMGIGLALLGRSLGRSDWIVLGLGGGLLHVWNHALFKALLFLGAGSVIHATHTREIDHLGGLSKTMPITAACFLVGAVAICGLPPLNGFISELLVYLGLFRAVVDGEGTLGSAVGLAAPALALIGTLAVVCFVKVFGTVFLGVGRSDHVRHAHESRVAMLFPMLALATCCLVIGLAPQWVVPALENGIRAWAPAQFAHVAPDLTALAPLSALSTVAVSLAAAVILLSVVFALRVRSTSVSFAATWGCGFAAPTSRMQYTSSSFAQMLVHLFAVVLQPTERLPRIAALFPSSATFYSQTPDTVLERVVRPLFRACAWLFTRLRVLQQGSIQTYLLYLFLTVVVLLFWR